MQHDFLGDHYRWIYKTVMQDEETIHQVIEQEKLTIG
jgi:hypothetical protein